MSAENPRGKNMAQHDELKPRERLVVMSVNVMESLGGDMNDRSICMFRDAEWNDDSSGIAFSLRQKVHKDDSFMLPVEYYLKVYDQLFPREPAERYFYYDALSSVDQCDERWKTYKRSNHNGNVATVLKYLDCAQRAISAKDSRTFEGIMSVDENHLCDPRLRPRLRRIARGVLSIRNHNE
jgi:hypothetical protein